MRRTVGLRVRLVMGRMRGCQRDCSVVSGGCRGQVCRVEVASVRGTRRNLCPVFSLVGFLEKVVFCFELVLVVSTVVYGILFACFPTVYSNHIKLSSDIINCRRKKCERKSTLSPLLMHFVTNTLCSRLQHTHFFKQTFLLDWNFFVTSMTS